MLSVERIKISEKIKKGRKAPFLALSIDARGSEGSLREEIMGMGTLGDIFKAQGISGSGNKKGEQESVKEEQKSVVETCSSELMDEFETWVLEWGVAALELLGKDRLIAALDRALEGGTNRDRNIFDAFIERQLVDMSHIQAEAYRERLPKLGGNKGYPTFCEEADEVYRALESGAVERFARQLVWPQIKEGESEMDYRNRLYTWAADKPEKLLKVAGFDAYDIARRAEEKRSAQKRSEDKKKSLQAIRDFEENGDYEALFVVAESLGGELYQEVGVAPACTIAAKSRFAWKLGAEGKVNLSWIEIEPTSEWLNTLDDVDFIIKCVVEAKWKYRQSFQERLLEVLPFTLDAQRAVVYGTKAIDCEGRVIPLSVWKWSKPYRGEAGFERELAEPQKMRLVYTKPHPEGWVCIHINNKEKTIRATLYSPQQFVALETALKCKRGGFDPRGWLTNFDRHPQKGFGRFLFRVQPGGRSWDQIFISVDDRLRERIELLRQLPDPEEVPFPDNIWYLPARLSSYKPDRGGHMVWDEKNPKQMICWKEKAESRQGAVRLLGKSIGCRSTGTATTWFLAASTRKNRHTMVVALIGKGEEVHLDSGLAICNVGGMPQEIPGGALRQDERLI